MAHWSFRNLALSLTFQAQFLAIAHPCHERTESRTPVMPMGLRRDKRSRDRQGAVSPTQESGPATSLRPTQADQNRRVFDGAVITSVQV